MVEVSVVIPNYNHENYLARRLDSVFNQTFSNFEVILLDDCSTDNSKMVLDQYRDDIRVSHYLINEKNSGSPFSQWEKGLKLARGKWVWIAESDDESDPFFLETMVRLAEENDNIGIAFSSSNWIDEFSRIGKDMSLFEEGYFREGSEEIRYHLWKHCTVPNVSSALIRKDVALDCVSGLGKFKACGDWVFYVRVLKSTNIVHTIQKLNYFRYYQKNTSFYAQKMGLWVSEGVYLLASIDHRSTYFSRQDMVDVVSSWMYKSLSLNWKRRWGVWKIVVQFIVRYLYQRDFNLLLFKEFIRGVYRARKVRVNP